MTAESGYTLRDLVELTGFTERQIRFPLGAALHIGAETARALHHAHSQRDELGLASPVMIVKFNPTCI